MDTYHDTVLARVLRGTSLAAATALDRIERGVEGARIDLAVLFVDDLVTFLGTVPANLLPMDLDGDPAAVGQLKDLCLAVHDYLVDRLPTGPFEVIDPDFDPEPTPVLVGLRRMLQARAGQAVADRGR